ncbi:hypothetical protein [Archangium primigenium]|uniref:hypothetical protein n=1 Tax=[Archangium] primigenium TaxID=2792470 RepID=UPI001958110A|nr:hypothetical protein [Archangium primigenium]MBM7112565.1 hypothetical protein [Archangium primigenium]
MTRSLCLLALTLLLPPLAACHGRDARPTAAPAETPLPDVFGPLDWSTDAARLRARFPEARVVEGPGADTLTTWETVATNAHLEPFGPVELQVLGYPGQRPVMLILQRTDDPFEECVSGDAPARAACVARRDHERRALHDTLEARLVSLHGPGTLGPLMSDAVPEAGDPVDPEQAERTWALPGLTLRLAIGLDPRFHQPRMVRLIASRDPSYPYPY